MTAAPATTNPTTEESTVNFIPTMEILEVGDKVYLGRGDYKGKEGTITAPYEGRTYGVTITVSGKPRDIRVKPGSLRLLDEPDAQVIDLPLPLVEEPAEEEIVAEEIVEEETAPKRRRISKIDPDADEVEQPERIETGDHEFNDEAKGIYPTPRHLGRGYIYRYNLGWRWHNTHDEAPSLEDRSEVFLLGYNDRMNRMKKWHSTWFGEDLDSDA